jgi:hypothetical protein
MPTTAWPLPNLETKAVNSILPFQCRVRCQASQSVREPSSLRGYKPKIAVDVLHELEFEVGTIRMPWQKPVAMLRSSWREFGKGLILSSKRCPHPSYTADTSPPAYNLGSCLQTPHRED